METLVPQEIAVDRPLWSEPVAECYETRPEVTAYAGESGPWQAR
ncbi:hypothetical protein FHX82_005038 [Amycolatopsis bartoniae]|uniref:Coenzyme PQQ synthesis protein A n=1 Tax=Amycolatopsis bartoniae TaxID=941986 RepID=A0A8H9IUW7_9PSEU|nr:hypothetical protein [Amycolatopsis bartoniae]MBB2937962.1 hypothetical protein [Amycolatopsis bartoniae]GHF41988.1 hypothetical protein GCM10017566_14400 [Amycolatopsis bartoniae]